MSDDDFWTGVLKDNKKESKPQTETPVEAPTVKSEASPAVESPPNDPFAAPQEQLQSTKPHEVEVQEAIVVGSTLQEPAVEDPFNTPTTEEPVIKNNLPDEITTPPLKAPIEVSEDQNESPFGESEGVSQQEEFEKTKPASSGKNLSIMIWGDKGTSKTTTALSLPGRIFAISLDQQTKIIHEDFFNSNPRIEVWDGIEFFNSKNPETKLETAVKTVEYINWLLENPCTNFKPDWILLDGTERLSHVCEMAMRAQENLLPYEGVKNRNAWKYRNDLVNNVVQRAVQIAHLGVVYTSFTNIKTVDTALGEEKREGPKWFGEIEQKTQIVIKMSSEKMQNGLAFVALVESSKVSYVPTGRRMVVGERLNSGEIQNYTGIKILFTPEGVKKYFSGGEQ